MRHHRRCVDLLIKGKNQLILIHAGDLSEANMYRAVDSEGLAALMFKQIVHIASRGEKKPNILVAYQNYMTKLVCICCLLDNIKYRKGRILLTKSTGVASFAGSISPRI